jgi:hypothetical protein
VQSLRTVIQCRRAVGVWHLAGAGGVSCGPDVVSPLCDRDRKCPGDCIAVAGVLKKFMGGLLSTTCAVLAATIAAAVLVVDAWLVALDRRTAGAFGARVRTAIPWSSSMVLAPLLPFYSLTHSQLAAAGFSSTGASLTWLAVGLALAEIYAVLLRRESWICAYEPHWIAADATPLGYQPRRFEDRRLHRLLRVQICFCIPVAIVAALTTFEQSSAAQFLVVAYFVFKYFSYSGPDFEAVVHWSMHTRTLAGLVRTPRERIAYSLMEYVCGPMNGYVPCVYESNHLMVHHVYNGHVGDIHSPAAYDRLSFVEFSFFALRLALDTVLCTDLLRHRNCKGRRRRRLMVSLVAFWAFVLVLLWLGSPLAYFLLFALLHHGITMARSQIIWHGLIDKSSRSGPAFSTVNWATSNEPSEVAKRCGASATEPGKTDP